MKTMKKIVAIVAVALMLVSILPLSVFAADAETIKYTISSFPAGTQYKAEAHELDDYLTIHTNTRCHFTTELRIYAPNGGVNGEVILASTRELTTVVLNAGNKTSTLTVSTSPDNSTWTQHSTLSVASSYADLSISNLPAGTKYIKLVNGSGQVRIKYITVSYAADVTEPEPPSACEHDWELISTTDATCTAAGEEYYECASCGESKTEAIEALGHNYGDAVETLAPTCTTAGEQQSTCSACGDVKTETVNALGHNYVNGNCSVCGAEQPLESTLDFSTTDQRTEYTTDVQVWENDGLKLTNNKAGSTSNVGDYANPARFYKSTEIIIEYPSMTQLVIDCSNTGETKYSTPWADTLDAAGLTYTVEGKVYTITFAEPVNSITLTTTAQVRANSITAYGAKAEEEVAVSFAGNSTSEDVSGLAFRFDVAVSGMDVINRTEAVYDNAYIGEYKLIKMGAILSNYKSEIDITANYLCELEDNSASYAVRIINIPETKYDEIITAIPYYVVEIDGVETTIYGEAQTASYNG